VTAVNASDAARGDILAFTAFPKAVWRQIWSNNPNDSTGRSAAAPTSWASFCVVIRLVGAVRAEQHDEWIEQRRYLGLKLVKQCRNGREANEPTPEVTIPALAITGWSPATDQPRTRSLRA
jgi:hypothetical protein